MWKQFLNKQYCVDWILNKQYCVDWIMNLFSHDFYLFRIQSTQYCLFKDCFHMISVYSGFSLTVLFIQGLFSHDFCLFRIQSTQYCLFKDCFHMISVYKRIIMWKQSLNKQYCVDWILNKQKSCENNSWINSTV
jgi:hypothetical protein